MRVNEENFATGDMEDVEPSYVEQVIGNHNIDEGAHPDIREHIADTQAFYQNAKDAVSNAEASAKEASEVSSAAAEAAEAAMESAQDAEKKMEYVVSHPCYIGENKNWFVFVQEEGKYVDSGICAEGYSPRKGIDYSTDEDKAEIKAYVEEYVNDNTYSKEDADNNFVDLTGAQDIIGAKTFTFPVRVPQLILKQPYTVNEKNVERRAVIAVTENGDLFIRTIELDGVVPKAQLNGEYIATEKYVDTAIKPEVFINDTFDVWVGVKVPFQLPLEDIPAKAGDIGVSTDYSTAYICKYTTPADANTPALGTWQKIVGVYSKAEIDEQLGDIETALLEIETMVDSLIGGGTV